MQPGAHITNTDDRNSLLMGVPRLSRWGVIASLVRRDYAVQFAGTSLGIVWVLARYVFQIALFYVIFGYVLQAALPEKADALTRAGEGDYLSYLLGAMCLWLPLSEMLLRSCGILSENRALIRRTSVGMHGFLWVPVVQAWLHYTLIFAAVSAIGLVRGTLSACAPLAFLAGLAILLSFAGWAFILARVSVLLRDVSPLMELVLQIVFWSTPIVYAVGPDLLWLFGWNPLYPLISLHRMLLFESDWPFRTLTEMPGLLLLAGLALPAFTLSARRLAHLVVDHL